MPALNSEATMRHFKVKLARNRAQRQDTPLASHMHYMQLAEHGKRLEDAIEYLNTRVIRHCEHAWLTHSREWLQCNECGKWELVEHD
jgi:hypothetical protein